MERLGSFSFNRLFALLLLAVAFSQAADAAVTWSVEFYSGPGYASGYTPVYPLYYMDYGPYYYNYYPYPYFYYSYPYYYPSQQPVVSTTSNYCSDGTAKGDCVSANNQPTGLLCSDRGIIRAASVCGCPNGYVAQGDTCVNTCTDGTPLNSCSQNRPNFCDSRGTLSPSSGQCGCPYGFVEDSRGGCRAATPTCSVDVNSYQVRAQQSISVAVNYYNQPAPLQTTQVACGDGQVVTATCGQAQNAGSQLSPTYQGTCTATCTYGPEAKYPSTHAVKGYAAGTVCGSTNIQVIPPMPTTGSLLVQATDCDTGEPISGATVGASSVVTPTPTPIPIVNSQSVEFTPGPGGRDTYLSMRSQTTTNTVTLQPAVGGVDTFIDSANQSDQTNSSTLDVGYTSFAQNVNLTNRIMYIGDNVTTSSGARVMLASVGFPIGVPPLPPAAFYVYNSSGALVSVQALSQGGVYTDPVLGFTLAVNIVFYGGVNFVNYADVNFSYQDTVNSTRRSLLYFNTSSIPTGATITSATLSLTPTVPGGAMNVSVHQATSNWAESATWYLRQPTTNWTNAGGDYVSTPVGTILVTGNNTYTLNATSLVSNWLAGTPNNGVLLKASNETIANLRSFHSSDSASATERPSLTVTYTTTNIINGDSNYGNSPNLLTGFDNATNTTYRSLLYFDVSSISANAQVSSAQLVLYSDGTGPSMAIGVHEASRNWTEGDGTTGSGASWYSYNGSANWSNFGGDYNGIAEATQTVTTAGNYSFDATNLVRRLITGSTNNGVLVRAVNENLGVKAFNSGDGVVRPRLRVNYTTITQQQVNVTPTTPYTATTYTGSNGEVIFDYMNPILHSFTVSKSGYVTASSSATAVLGTVVPVGVCLRKSTCDVTAVLVGSTRDLVQVRVANNLNSNQTASLNYSGAFQLDGPVTVSLGANEQKIVNIIPRIPATSVGATQAVVSVAGNGTCRSNVNVPIVNKGGVSVSALESSKQGVPGVQTCYKMQVRNSGQDKGTVSMSASGDLPTKLSPIQFPISSLETRYVDLCVNTPGGASGDHVFTVNASSPINDAVASVTLKLPTGLAFSSDFSGCANIEPSQTPVNYPVTLSNNLGSGDYVASVAGATSGISIAQPLLYNFGDEARTVYLTVDTNQLPAGENRFDLVLKKDNRIVSQQQLCFTHGAREEVSVDILPSSITVPRGASQSALVSVRNNGNVRSTYTINSSTTFSALTVTPGTLTVDAGDEGQTYVYVNPAQFTAAGSYTIPIQVYSNNKVVANQTLLVRVVAELLFHSTITDQAVGISQEGAGAKVTVEFVAKNDEQTPVTVTPAITGLPSDWVVNIEPENALLSPGESRKFVATIFADSPETKDYPATIELSTSDGKKAFAPVNIPLSSYGRFSGLFALGSSEGLIGLFLVLLAGAGLYLYSTARKNAMQAEEAESKPQAARLQAVKQEVKPKLPAAPVKKAPAKRK